MTDPGIQFIVGWAAVFHALDAGEAPGAGPDQITLIHFFEDPAVATAFCEQRDGIEGYDVGLVDIAAGSVQMGRVERDEALLQRRPRWGAELAPLSAALGARGPRGRHAPS